MIATHRPQLALDQFGQDFQLDEAERLERSDCGLERQLFSREPIDSQAFPTEFACPDEYRPIKIGLVGIQVATAQARAVDGPLLAEIAKSLITLAARNQKEGGDPKPAPKHPMDDREVGRSFITGNPVGEFTGHLVDALALPRGQMPFVGSDRISPNEPFRLDEIPPGNLHDIAMAIHADVLTHPVGGRW